MYMVIKSSKTPMSISKSKIKKNIYYLERSNEQILFCQSPATKEWTMELCTDIKKKTAIHKCVRMFLNATYPSKEELKCATSRKRYH